MEYQAEEGMTWEGWVESEYNTGAFYVSFTNYIGYLSGSIVVYNQDCVFKTDYIYNNFKYTVSGGSND